MKGVDLPFKTIEELRDIAYSIVGEPEKVQFGDRVVGIIEARDGTIMDVVRQIKPEGMPLSGYANPALQ